MSSPAVYSPKEERLNILTHLFGFVLSIVGSVLLIQKSTDDPLTLISVIVYGLSMMILYAASTAYHFSTKVPIRKKLQILDHASIFILIAGTYTPFTLLILPSPSGWIIFGITWFLAIIGVVLKVFFTGRYNRISTLLYVLLGWNIVFVLFPLIDNLGWEGFYWLLAGGVIYTLGAILFLFEKLPFNHSIFHIFVLMGSILQYISIYFFVI